MIAVLALLRQWRVLALCAGAACLFGFGWHHGAQSAEARHSAALMAAQARAIHSADRLRLVEAARLDAVRRADALSLELEDAADADPDADRPALSLDSVRRLNSR